MEAEVTSLQVIPRDLCPRAVAVVAVFEDRSSVIVLFAATAANFAFTSLFMKCCRHSFLPRRPTSERGSAALIPGTQFDYFLVLVLFTAHCPCMQISICKSAVFAVHQHASETLIRMEVKKNFIGFAFAASLIGEKVGVGCR